MEFSFSGIKTAMYRLVEKETPLNKTKIENLASSFQDKVFQHFTNVFTTLIKTHSVSDVLFGGGVSSNIEIRKRLRRICSVNGATLHLPYSKKLCTDNAAMIGLVAFYKFQKGESLKGDEINAVERSPRLNV